jgi:hypothetical protein
VTIDLYVAINRARAPRERYLAVVWLVWGGLGLQGKPKGAADVLKRLRSDRRAGLGLFSKLALLRSQSGQVLDRLLSTSGAAGECVGHAGEGDEEIAGVRLALEFAADLVH